MAIYRYSSYNNSSTYSIFALVNRHEENIIAKGDSHWLYIIWLYDQIILIVRYIHDFSIHNISMPHEEIYLILKIEKKKKKTFSVKKDLENKL
jgi:hypothetical protein